MIPKAKRGQVCVVHTKHTYTHANFARTTYDRATVGVVCSASREGEIKAYRPLDGYGDSSPVVRLDRLAWFEAVYAITDDFDHARAIVAVVERKNPEFDSVDAAKEFLRPFLK